MVHRATLLQNLYLLYFNWIVIINIHKHIQIFHLHIDIINQLISDILLWLILSKNAGYL